MSVECTCDSCGKKKDLYACEDCYDALGRVGCQDAEDKQIEIDRLKDEVEKLQTIIDACDRCTHHKALDKL